MSRGLGKTWLTHKLGWYHTPQIGYGSVMELTVYGLDYDSPPHMITVHHHL